MTPAVGQVCPSLGRDQSLLVGSAWVLEGGILHPLLPARVPEPGEADSYPPDVLGANGTPGQLT